MATVSVPDVYSIINYDKEKELKEFDATKAGVKGLVDSGITRVPRIFVHPKVDDDMSKDDSGISLLQIPIIDLEGFHDNERREKLVDEIGKASETWGIFQVVGHGIPMTVIEEMLEAVKGFHEMPSEEKVKLYSRDPTRIVRWCSHPGLFALQTADWTDCMFFDTRELDQNENHPVFREAVDKYLKCMITLKDTISKLITKSIGLSDNHLEQIEYMNTGYLSGNYYPACPEPEKTLGIHRHIDTGVLTMLLQDNIGGALQVQHQGCWIDVPPLPGAIIVNFGTLMQLLTNDKYKAVEHRVLAQRVGPRVSTACLFRPSFGNTCALPLKEFICEENPPVFKATNFDEFHAHFLKVRDNIVTLDHFRL